MDIKERASLTVLGLMNGNVTKDADDMKSVLAPFAQLMQTLCDSKNCPFKVTKCDYFHLAGHALAEYARLTLEVLGGPLDNETLCKRAACSAFIAGTRDYSNGLRNSRILYKRCTTFEDLVARVQDGDFCNRCLDEPHASKVCDQWGDEWNPEKLRKAIK